MPIQILSNDVINQIAAGEVVERPAHLIKELIENSLDAGADQITIEVASGGRSVRVLDNGSGILSSDIQQALQRHATSKITKTSDLWALNTFGFRGEALASAAAVSKLTLRSSEKTEKKPSQIDSEFGVISTVKPSSTVIGTEVKIESLFDNVPARLKFLKSDSAEVQQIKTVVKALALAHFDVEFKLVSEGSLQLYYSKKKNKLERVKDVLEQKKFYEVKSESSDYKCHIAFSSPYDVAKTSKQIWLFVQNRWVQDRALQAAIMDAYRSLLMHGEYPQAVLWFECNPEYIDVNIHPTKSQIKFQDPSAAFRMVQNTLRQSLEKAPWIEKTESATTQYEINDISTKPVENLKFFDHQFEKTQFKNKTFNLNDLSALKVDSTDISKNETTQGYWSSLQVIGQANLTYIVCQKNDRLVFVDQHAAHERVVFESLMRSWKNQNFEIQDFLFPLAVDLSEDKIEALLKAKSEITRLGFEIEQLGPEVLGIKAAPLLLRESCLPVVFSQLATDLIQNGGSYALEKKISDLFATMACHSVVRAGQSLSAEQMSELLKSMDEFALSSFCPHGRPVSVEKTFNELERLFGRIN